MIIAHIRRETWTEGEFRIFHLPQHAPPSLQFTWHQANIQLVNTPNRGLTYTPTPSNGKVPRPVQSKLFRSRVKERESVDTAADQIYSYSKDGARRTNSYPKTLRPYCTVSHVNNLVVSLKSMIWQFMNPPGYDLIISSNLHSRRNFRLQLRGAASFRNNEKGCLHLKRIVSKSSSQGCFISHWCWLQFFELNE